MDDKVSLLKEMLESYCKGVAKFIELELLYLNDFSRTRYEIGKIKDFYNHVLQLDGETGYIPTQRSRIG